MEIEHERHECADQCASRSRGRPRIRSPRPWLRGCRSSRPLPSGPAISQCGRTPLLERGSPHVRMTVFASSPPAGTSGSVMFGSSATIAANAASMSVPLAAARRSSSAPRARPRSIRSSTADSPLLLPSPDFVGDGVALGPLVFDGSDRPAPLLFQRFGTVERRRGHRIQHAAPAKRLADGLRMIAK